MSIRAGAIAAVGPGSRAAAAPPDLSLSSPFVTSLPASGASAAIAPPRSTRRRRFLWRAASAAGLVAFVVVAGQGTGRWRWAGARHSTAAAAPTAPAPMPCARAASEPLPGPSVDEVPIPSEIAARPAKTSPLRLQQPTTSRSRPLSILPRVRVLDTSAPADTRPEPEDPLAGRQ